MDILEFREYCLSLPLSEETTPFDEDTLVYKIGGKMYALAGIDAFSSVIIKCAPDEGAELCERHTEVTPAYHMNKRHWVELHLDGTLDDNFVKQYIANSYRLVIKGITPRAKREELEELLSAFESAE